MINREKARIEAKVFIENLMENAEHTFLRVQQLCTKIKKPTNKPKFVLVINNEGGKSEDMFKKDSILSDDIGEMTFQIKINNRHSEQQPQSPKKQEQMSQSDILAYKARDSLLGQVKQEGGNLMDLMKKNIKNIVQKNIRE